MDRHRCQNPHGRVLLHLRGQECPNPNRGWLCHVLANRKAMPHCRWAEPSLRCQTVLLFFRQKSFAEHLQPHRPSNTTHIPDFMLVAHIKSTISVCKNTHFSSSDAKNHIVCFFLLRSISMSELNFISCSCWSRRQISKVLGPAATI